jgi:hypothetical protein
MSTGSSQARIHYPCAPPGCEISAGHLHSLVGGQPCRCGAVVVDETGIQGLNRQHFCTSHVISTGGGPDAAPPEADAVTGQAQCGGGNPETGEAELRPLGVMSTDAI